MKKKVVVKSLIIYLMSKLSLGKTVANNTWASRKKLRRRRYNRCPPLSNK